MGPVEIVILVLVLLFVFGGGWRLLLEPPQRVSILSSCRRFSSGRTARCGSSACGLHHSGDSLSPVERGGGPLPGGNRRRAGPSVIPGGQDCRFGGAEPDHCAWAGAARQPAAGDTGEQARATEERAVADYDGCIRQGGGLRWTSWPQGRPGESGGQRDSAQGGTQPHPALPVGMTAESGPRDVSAASAKTASPVR